MSVDNTAHLISADRLFDGKSNVLRDNGVVFSDSQILAVGYRVELLQKFDQHNLIVEHFDNCTLMPGLIDTHTHLIMPGTGQPIVEYAQTPDELLLLVAARNAWQSLKAGVTTVVDLGAKSTITFRLREALEQKIITGSRLLLCGRALTITGGHGWPWLGEADGIDGVRQAVRQLCKEGADLIKVMVTGGGTPGTDGRRPAYTLPELCAIVDEAHRRNRKVMGHCTATKGIELALEAGFDLIAHCQFLAPDGSNCFDEQSARRLINQGVFVNPTLQINRILTTDRVPLNQFPPEQRASLEAWMARYPEFEANFARLYSMGVRIICGSDCGWGWSTFDETYLELDAMVAAGMSTIDALVSATGNAAEALGWSERIGSLEPGKKADLLVVAGDPTVDICTLKNVRRVWLEGQPVECEPSLGFPSLNDRKGGSS